MAGIGSAVYIVYVPLQGIIVSGRDENSNKSKKK